MSADSILSLIYRIFEYLRYTLHHNNTNACYGALGLLTYYHLLYATLLRDSNTNPETIIHYLTKDYRANNTSISCL